MKMPWTKRSDERAQDDETITRRRFFVGVEVERIKRKRKRRATVRKRKPAT